MKGPVVAAMLLALTAPAAAHHSGAGVDRTRTITVAGVVKEFRWTNPHSWLQLEAGGIEYSIELGSPNSMSRRGWRKTTFLPGDKVTVVMNPMRDGAPGGAMVYAIDRTGKRMAWR